MLSDLISSGDKDAALKYLSDMGDFMDHTEKFVSSGNERIDSILNYYIEKAKNTDIHVSWKIQIPEQIEISTFDTVIGVGYPRPVITLRLVAVGTDLFPQPVIPVIEIAGHPSCRIGSV